MSADDFLEMARQVDAFATLNYSKSKRISAVDVELHLRSKGVLAPVTTSSMLLIDGMASQVAASVQSRTP
jgi:hypothetical protein